MAAYPLKSDFLLKGARGSSLLVGAGAALMSLSYLTLAVFEFFDKTYDFNLSPNRLFGPWGNLVGVIYLFIICWINVEAEDFLPDHPRRAGFCQLLSFVLLLLALQHHVTEASYQAGLTSSCVIFWPYYDLVLIVACLFGSVCSFQIKNRGDD